MGGFRSGGKERRVRLESTDSWGAELRPLFLFHLLPHFVPLGSEFGSDFLHNTVHFVIGEGAAK